MTIFFMTIGRNSVIIKFKKKKSIFSSGGEIILDNIIFPFSIHSTYLKLFGLIKNNDMQQKAKLTKEKINI